MAGSKSVLVIGGGVVGLSVACYARRMGHEVTVIERGGPDRDFCSLGNAGLVTPSHFVPLAAPGVVSMGLRMMMRPESPFYFRPGKDRDLWEWAWLFRKAATPAHVKRAAPLLLLLNLESRLLFEDLAQELNDFGFERKGVLMLCNTDRVLHHEAEAAELGRRLGLAPEVLDAKGCERLEPGLRMTVAGGVYYPEDAHLIPDRFVAELARSAEAMGVRFLWSSEVTGWKTDGSRIAAVQTQQGNVPADAFVLAAGSWSSRLAKGLGMRLPVVGGKGYNLTLPHPRKRLTTPAILIEGRVAVTPMGDTLRFAGTMEIGGEEAGINPARLRGIRKSVPAYFPEFGPQDFENVPGWSGLRPCSPDGLPYIGPFRRYPNLYAATGHAMMGLSLGPITGKLTAELLSGEPPSMDLRAFSPDRYA